MGEPPDEAFGLDIDPIDAYLRETPAVIERQRASTANIVAILLVVGVVASLPLHVLAVWLSPDATDALTTVFEKWYAMVSPLAGAAVGAYYVSRSASRREARRK